MWRGQIVVICLVLFIENEVGLVFDGIGLNVKHKIAFIMIGNV